MRYQSQWPSLTSQQITNAGAVEKVWRKGNPPLLLVAMEIDTTTIENIMEVPQKTKCRTTIWSTNPTPEHMSRQNYNSKRYMYHHVPCRIWTLQAMFIKTAKTWKQLKCPSTDECYKKMWYRGRQDGRRVGGHTQPLPQTHTHKKKPHLQVKRLAQNSNNHWQKNLNSNNGKNLMI